MPENFPLINTWTASPEECTLMLGLFLPRRNDSDELMSTLLHENQKTVRFQLHRTEKARKKLDGKEIHFN
jgi:hypothetical protein